MNKQVREMIEARGMKESDLPPLVYLVEEGSEDFEEAMKTQTLNDVTTLQTYIMDNISPEDRAKLKTFLIKVDHIFTSFLLALLYIVLINLCLHCVQLSSLFRAFE